MSSKRYVPANVVKTIWSESMGHCMNPDCQIDLFASGNSIGVMAHIVEHKVHGEASSHNMLVLCSNCHTQIDADRTEHTIPMLLHWKKKRNSELQEIFAKRCSSFCDLEELVRPILRRNARIFSNYGPTNTDSNEVVRRKLWLKFEPELIVNNQKLLYLFEANLHLFQLENKQTIEAFIAHINEFVVTRNDDFPDRLVFFPTDINAIFGLKSPGSCNLPPNVSALQNLINRLTREDRFISLELTPRQLLSFTDKQGKKRLLDLSNRPRMQQVYFNGGFYRPQTTEVRLNDLVYILGWLDKRGFEYHWESISRLTELRIVERFNVAFCYKYSWSEVDTVDLINTENVIIVNLYGWNNSDIDNDAVLSTSATGIHRLNQREFCNFMLRSRV